MKTALAILLALALQDEKVIQFEAPKEWTKGTPASQMRKAQYKVPDKEKKEKEGELILYYFGKQGAGGVDDNLKRWAGQMGQTEFKPERIEGKCKITLIDVKGTYAERPGSDPLANARMIGAIVETDAGPWYFKLVGPADTVGDWREELVKLLKDAGL
jgi:hypothetical protein